jgi:RNA-directed DNA polymerase
MDYRIGAINRFTTAWMAYFQLADSASAFRDLGRWLRRRLRPDPLEALEDHRRQAAQPTDTRYLRAQRPKMGRKQQGILGIAGSGILHVALPNTYWTRLGLKTLSQTWQRLYQTA